MYPKHTLIQSLIDAEEDRRMRAGLTRTVGDSTTVYRVVVNQAH